MKKILLLVLTIFLFSSCKDENEDVVKEPSKDGSIQATLTTKHNDGYDVLTTEYSVWANGKVDKSFVKNDTLKSLGTTKEEGEDEDGNVQDITLPKDYEIFITVK